MATKKNASSTESTEENAPSTESTEENASSAKKQNPLKDFTGNKTLLTLSGLMLLGLLGGLLSAFGVFTDLRAIVWSVSIWLMVGGAAVLAGAWGYGTWMSRQKQATDEPAKKLTKGDETARRAMFAFLTASVVGLLFIVIFAIDSENFATFVSISSVGVMIAGASMLIGGLLGFLFGIPRTLQQAEPAQQLSPAADGAGKAANKEAQKPAYAANTNLEEISDWLTKILVGVGLTQIGTIRGELWALAQRLAAGLGDSPGNAVFALAIMIFFSVSGFMLGFLWTRLYLAGAFRRADTDLSDQVNALARKTEERDTDSTAHSLILEQLDTDTDDIDQKSLTDAIKAATKDTQVSIFTRARNVRRRTWKEEETKPEMEKTIRVFRALVAADPKMHRYHAQLGYTLKDKDNPEWEEAEQCLNKAIEIRDRVGGRGYLLYEFNRAICRIHLKRDKEAILDDLRKVAMDSWKSKLIKKVKAITTWMKANKVTPKDLGI